MANPAQNAALTTKLTRDLITGACGTCQRDVTGCFDEKGKFHCAGWLADEKVIAEILKDEADTTA